MKSAFLNSVYRHAGAFAFSSAAQVISSLTNFGIVLYLVRVLEKAQFGLYGLGFALILVLAGLIAASIAVQFVVNLPDQPKQQRGSYALHHVLATGTVGVGLILLAVAVTAFVDSTEPWRALLSSLALPVAVAAAFYALRDMLMRVAYSERREQTVLASSAGVAVAVLLGFGFAHMAGWILDAGIALYLFALGQAVGVLASLPGVALPRTGFTRHHIVQAFRDSWKGGRWQVLTSAVYSLRSQSHNLVVAPLLGVSALAEINAARVLVQPALLAIPPLTQLLMPRLAESRAQSRASLASPIKWSVALLAGVAAIYCTALLFAVPWLLPWALGDQYAHVGPLVLSWCVLTLFLALRNGLTLVLQVLRAFRQLMLANLAAAAVAITLSVVLVQAIGGLGAVWALVVAELSLCAVLLLLIAVDRRNPVFNSNQK